MSNIIDPPPHPSTPIIDERSGKINYSWYRWFTQLTQILNNEALANLGTSASATGSGSNEPYATHDGNDSPVPYSPDGFVTVSIGGTDQKIPFFKV